MERRRVRVVAAAARSVDIDRGVGRGGTWVETFISAEVVWREKD